MRIPQVAIDQSGLIMTRPDSFAPLVDIYAGDKYMWIRKYLKDAKFSFLTI